MPRHNLRRDRLGGTVILVPLFLFGIAVLPTFSQGRDMGCSPTVANPCKGDTSRSSSSSVQSSRDPAAEEAAARRNAAHNLNENGVAAFNRGDYEAALKLFKQAAERAPDNPVIKKNLDNAQAAFDFQQGQKKEAEEAARRNKAAVAEMQQNAKALADSLTVSADDGLNFESSTNRVSSPSLEFTNDPASPAPCGGQQELGFGDTRTVDARCVPSGLTKFIDDSIAKEFAKSPEGVGDRVRKGFQALMAQDRSVARSWFEQALKLDPNNEGLKRVIDLIADTSKYQSRPKVVLTDLSRQLQQWEREWANMSTYIAYLEPPTGQTNLLQIPSSDEAVALMGDGRPRPGQANVLQVPQTDDVAFLFQGNDAAPTIYLKCSDGTFRVLEPIPGGTVFYAEGPFKVLPNGVLKPSTDPEDMRHWEIYVKNDPPKLVVPPKSAKKP